MNILSRWRLCKIYCVKHNMRLENLCKITNLIMLITNYNHEINLVVVLNCIDSYKVRDIYTEKYHVPTTYTVCYYKFININIIIYPELQTVFFYFKMFVFVINYKL